MSTIQISQSIAGVNVTPGTYEVVANADNSVVTFVLVGRTPPQAGTTAPPQQQNTWRKPAYGGRSNGGGGGSGKFLSNEDKLALAQANLDMLNDFEKSFVAANGGVPKTLAAGRKLSDKQFEILNKIAFKVQKNGGTAAPAAPAQAPTYTQTMVDVPPPPEDM